MRAAGIVAIAYVIGAIPFSHLFARSTGVDLRTYRTGTVSATSLFHAAGFWPMAAAGVLDIAKGAAGPALAGPTAHPLVAALAGGAAVCGHNWSIFLKGAGGRGISPALGATAAASWPGTVVLALGLALGRSARETGLGCFVAIVLLTPVLAIVEGADGAWLGLALTIPLLAKRAAGNGPAQGGPSPSLYVQRIVFDREEQPA